MDCTAAHCDGYSPRCSCTNRTARSRTSGENLLFLLMAPFSQRLEPPQNSVRFNAKTLNTLLGTWYIQLRKLCQGTALEPFLRVVIEVASQKFDGSLGLDASTHLAAEVIDHIGLPQAAKLMGVSRDYLFRSVMNGVCSYRTRTVG